MTIENRLSASKQHTRVEGERLVAEFVSSGMPWSEFCQSGFEPRRAGSPSKLETAKEEAFRRDGAVPDST
jgi:hypothetical protein